MTSPIKALFRCFTLPKEEDAEIKKSASTNEFLNEEAPKIILKLDLSTIETAEQLSDAINKAPLAERVEVTGACSLAPSKLNDALKNLQNLTELSFINLGLNNDELASTIAGLSTLKSFACNEEQETDATPLVRTLADDCPKLEELDLKGSLSIHPVLGQPYALEKLAKTHKLSTLHLDPKIQIQMTEEKFIRAFASKNLKNLTAGLSITKAQEQYLKLLNPQMITHFTPNA